MGKSIRIGMNRDLVVKTENALLNTVHAVNGSLVQLGRNVQDVKDAQDLFYETLLAHMRKVEQRTLAARWHGLVRWLGKR